MTEDEARAQLAAAGYGQDAVEGLVQEARRWPGRFAYTADRHRCAVYQMPAGTWQVADCAATEDRIRALRGNGQAGAPGSRYLPGA